MYAGICLSAPVVARVLMATEDTSIRLSSELADEAAPVVNPLTNSRPLSTAASSSLPDAAPPIVPDDKTVISKRPPLPPDALPQLPATHLLGDTLVGKRLEHYELNEFVGGGGMGAVFRATDTRLGRTVAVKVLSRDHGDEETIRRFRNEAQSAARLDHPNIARVYYVGEDHGWNFIVFEFIEGTNLRDEVERAGPMELEQAMNYTLQVAQALAHSSSRDIVHRDIKPSNVLVTANKQIKLVDMGLARLHQVESSTDDLTASGVTLGTFDYISPEQARDPRAADVRSDIYSLGCTLFYMLTGQPPFPDGTALQKLLRHNSDEPPDVRQFRPELPPRVSGLLAKMLSKRPSQRQQSPDELIADVVALGQQLGLASIAEFGHIAVVPASLASQWWNKAGQVLAAVALLIVAGVALEAVLSSGQAGGDFMLRTRFKPAQAANANDQPPAEPDSPDVRAANMTPTEATSPGHEIEAAASSLAADATVSSASRLPSTKVESLAGENSATDAPSVGTVATGPDGSRIVESTELASAAGSSQSGNAVVRSTPKPQRVVVLGDVPSPPEPLVEYVATLAEACAKATEAGLNEIELRQHGPIVEQPFDLIHPRLTIRAAAGYQPVIVFRPEVRAAERHMIRLASGSSCHIAFEGLEFRMELPPDPPADGWSLLAVSTGQSLDFNQCVLTVQDGTVDRVPIHDQVAMISVLRRRLGNAMSMMDMQAAMAQPARISLERCIARGEASLIRMTDETPLTVRWNQGLLATNRHLIETGGTAVEPQYYEEIVLDLDNVTAMCRQGMYYLRRGPGKSFQFRVNAYADNCIFVADAGAPLFEMIGLPAKPELDELQSTGEGNRFSPFDMPFLFVRAAPGAEPQAFKLGRSWSSSVTRSQAGVPWVHAPPLDRPFHELTKSDFVIESDPAADGAGFDPLLLPTIAPPPMPAVASPTSGSSLPSP
jgi:hypothetical protein